GEGEYEERMGARAEREQGTREQLPRRCPRPPERGPAGKGPVNVTDPESRIMPTSENGWQQAYNAQAAVDMDTHLIVGGQLSQAPNDKEQLQPTLDILDGLPDALGNPENIVADNGYCSEDNSDEVVDREMSPYLTTGR